MSPKYLCFTRDHNLDAALQTFRERYHAEPKGHQYQYGILMVGPIPGSDEPTFRTVAGIADPGKPVTLLDQHGDEFQLLMF